MNDLITRAQSETEEVGHGYRGYEISQGHQGANFVDTVGGVGCHVKMLLGSDNVHILPVVDYLAQEGHILQRKYGEILFLNVIA